ncbi:hypothetical protein QYE76_060023 [Lolium multiflorum]|uniref:Reverse transcriptase Ty1/copia-type domain-containing protein n=1 Tax=Lolium multiflorum TaxID=4521 RepID=A0AAD8RZM8_LOLMU|nr:hypothetical protein QYE76_060023 [Lolium multiflorum]
MSKMRFFLGFEIKQLREGTFINQAKYLQDLLKRFKMKEMKGVATQMVTKCHLALDPNGKEVDQKFYATVHFDQDEAKTFLCMTHETLLEAKLASFGAALGYPRSPVADDNGWRSHDSSFALTKEVLAPLYIKGWGIPGKSADLLPTWDIMLRVYRETIGPKGGNLNEIHTYEVDLLANSHAKQGTGERLDVMNDIYNEMWSCVMEKKLPIFAPYIMKLLQDSWISTRQAPLIHSIALNITAHEVKSLRLIRLKRIYNFLCSMLLL